VSTITEDELRAFVHMQLRKARQGSERIPFEILEKSATVNRQANGDSRIDVKASASVADDPRYDFLTHGYGVAAFAVVLAVDLRNSTNRAAKHGPEATYLTMHTYLPTMAYLVNHCGGKVIGLRGDGLFAGFQITDALNQDETFDSTKATSAATQSVECGFGMVQAVERVLNPILKDEKIPDDLRVGVGITSGNLVITRIGFDSASEITAYGSCVNDACKLSSHGQNEVYISSDVRKYYPSSPNGKVSFRLMGNRGFLLEHYPIEVVVSKARRKAK
jgi:adenylate cyclase